jgi:hypothetical protein
MMAGVPRRSPEGLEGLRVRLDALGLHAEHTASVAEYARVERDRVLLEAVDAGMTVADAARAARVSRVHAHRVLKAQRG